jgi:D-sedoheptulose 7-phosphate isomerase
MALGLSTSGNSANLLRAFAEGRRRGLLTVGVAGYDGGQMAACADVDHCLVAQAESVHRIQESQAALVFAIWTRVQSLVREAGGNHR